MVCGVAEPVRTAAAPEKSGRLMATVSPATNAMAPVNVTCGVAVRGLEYGVWNMGFGIWGLEYGGWHVGFGIWGLGYGVRGSG